LYSLLNPETLVTVKDPMRVKTGRPVTGFVVVSALDQTIVPVSELPPPEMLIPVPPVIDQDTVVLVGLVSHWPVHPPAPPVTVGDVLPVELSELDVHESPNVIVSAYAEDNPSATVTTTAENTRSSFLYISNLPLIPICPDTEEGRF
jgi:hypothetical protein